MDETDIINHAIEYIETLFLDDCGGHDAAQSMRVYRNASLIADTQPDCDRFIVSLQRFCTMWMTTNCLTPNTMKTHDLF